ncbi:glutamine synthetase family protein [Rhodococcus olei]|uniref:Glutamine synthetase family protein n=1 Tax=Rhodococcus olei TaxID=2161675 RepID=A0ABP8PH81_9NOCA
MATRQPGLVIGSVVDMAGVARAKVMPADRLDAFVTAGAGASTCWMVFCADDHLAFTDTLSVVGDLRLRIARDDLRDLGEGTWWAPADLTVQDGGPWPGCPRRALRSMVGRLAADGVDALVGHELEFVLFDATGAGEWSAYGLGAAVRQRGFVSDLLSAADLAGLVIDQVHAEYGPNQYELSLAPADPVTAADQAVLARLLVSVTARTHGMSASFSPLPLEGGAGNGAHQHLSLTRGGVPLLSGGDGPRGLTDTGCGAVAGLLAVLPDFMLLLAGSPLSHLRLLPDHWAGVYCCWGLENREAAVRLCADTPGNPHGANIEVKPIDPSANPYLATTVLLGGVHTGITDALPLPPEVTVNPSRLSETERAEAGVTLLPTDAAQWLDRFADSRLARELFDPVIHEAVGAVRGYELDRYRGRSVDEVCERLRWAWTG